MAPRSRLPAKSAWTYFILRTIYLLDSIILLIFSIYLELHAWPEIFMSIAAAAWGILIATAEMIGLASPRTTKVRRISPIWLFVCELISLALFAAALGMTAGSFFGTSSQVLVGVWPNEQWVTIPQAHWLYGAFIMQIVGTLLAFMFMVIGCVDWCRKAR